MALSTLKLLVFLMTHPALDHCRLLSPRWHSEQQKLLHRPHVVRDTPGHRRRTIRFELSPAAPFLPSTALRRRVPLVHAVGRVSHLECCLWSHSRVDFPRKHSFLGKLQAKCQHLITVFELQVFDGHGLQSPATNVAARLVGIPGDQRRPTTETQQGQFVPVLENVIVGLATLDQVNHLLLPDTAVEVLGHTL